MSETPSSGPGAPPPPGGFRIDHGSTGQPTPSTGPAAEPDAPSTSTATVAPPAPPAPPAPAATASAGDGRRRPKGAGFGIVLIVVGVLLLLSNLVPGWSFGQFWPVIVILLGLFSMVSPKSGGEPRINKVMDGLVLAAIGCVLLANTTDYLPWSVWWSILSLWPVLVISGGLAILGRGIGQRWLGAVGSLLVLGALLWAAFGMPTNDATINFTIAANLQALIGGAA